jgi:hypothetical protein
MAGCKSVTRKQTINSITIIYYYYYFIISSSSAAQRGLWPPRFTRFFNHTQRRATVTLLWTSDQLVAETSTWQHTQHTNIHAPGVIRTHDRSRRAAVDLRLGSRGHWDHKFHYDKECINTLCGAHDHYVYKLSGDSATNTCIMSVAVRLKSPTHPSASCLDTETLLRQRLGVPYYQLRTN